MTYASFVRWSLQLLILTALFGLLLGEGTAGEGALDDEVASIEGGAVEADVGNVTDAPLEPPCDGPEPCDEHDLVIPDLDE